MKHGTCLLLALILVAIIQSTRSAGNIVVCYLGSWAVYSDGGPAFSFDSFDPGLCSHLNYAFVGLRADDGSIYVLDEYADIELGGFRKTNELKQRNSNLKTLISVGGFEGAAQTFSAVAGDPSKRRKFIDTSMDLIGDYGFDGIDIDWEYPTQNGGVPADRENFVTLLREFREECDRRNLLLTVAVNCNREIVRPSYAVQDISDLVDIINVMTYDFHGPWSDSTGENSPLYSSDGYNVADGVGNWLNAGADRSKTVIGLGAYGHTFTLSDPNQNGIGAPINGPGAGGPFTHSEGEMAYYEICYLLNDGSWNVVWSDEQQVPYAYKGDQWIGYDTPESILLKVKFAESEGLAGVMVWSIGEDDFDGICNGSRSPLLQTVHDYYYNRAF